MSGTRGIVAATVALLLLLSTGCDAEEPVADPPTSQGPAGPVLLSLSVYGPAPVVTAYAELASRFSVANPGVTVSVRPFGTAGAARDALARQARTDDLPDAFLAPLGDLPELVATRRIQRVDELLGEREVNFGDGFQRTSLEAFSADNALQCLPVDVSPLVVYYNTDLIDLAELTEPDQVPVDASTGWTLEQFAAAAAQVTRSDARGLYIAPVLEQVAPFLESGGGALVDDLREPTTLRLASGGSAEAMEKLLAVVRDPQLTFDEDEIAAEPAVRRFEDGRLGMMLGYRDLTPRLRGAAGLDFDVMPLPSLGGEVTVGRSAGLCLSAATLHPAETADFLAYVASEEAATLLAETGYVVPSNLVAVHSPAFLQPSREPANADVFYDAVRDIRPMPAAPGWDAVVRMAAPLLTDLFYDPVIDPVARRLEMLDSASVPLLVTTTEDEER